jgi:hypothetical protein
MEISPSNISCGVKQLYDLGYWSKKFDGPAGLTSGPHSTTIQQVTAQRHAIFTSQYSGVMKGYTYLFSDAESYGNGTNFAKFIKQENLGELTEGHTTVNPNSSNKIRVWVWTYNGKKPSKYHVEP